MSTTNTTREELQSEQDFLVGHVLIPASMIGSRRMTDAALGDLVDAVASRSTLDIENSVAYFARLRDRDPDSYKASEKTFKTLDSAYRRELLIRKLVAGDEVKVERRAM